MILLMVYAVIADLSVRNVVEAVDKVGNCRLARAGSSYERDLLSGLGVKRDIVQYRLVLLVLEIDVKQPYVTLKRLVCYASVG